MTAAATTTTTTSTITTEIVQFHDFGRESFKKLW